MSEWVGGGIFQIPRARQPCDKQVLCLLNANYLSYLVRVCSIFLDNTKYVVINVWGIPLLSKYKCFVVDQYDQNLMYSYFRFARGCHTTTNN